MIIYISQGDYDTRKEHQYPINIEVHVLPDKKKHTHTQKGDCKHENHG